MLCLLETGEVWTEQKIGTQVLASHLHAMTVWHAVSLFTNRDDKPITHVHKLLDVGKISLQ